MKLQLIVHHISHQTSSLLININIQYGFTKPLSAHASSYFKVVVPLPAASHYNFSHHMLDPSRPSCVQILQKRGTVIFFTIDYYPR